MLSPLLLVAFFLRRWLLRYAEAFLPRDYISESVCGKSVDRVSHFVLSKFSDSLGCANCAIS